MKKSIAASVFLVAGFLFFASVAHADFNYGLYYTLSSRNDAGTLLDITVQNGSTPFPVGIGSFYIYPDDPNALPIGSDFRVSMPGAFSQTLHQLFPAVSSPALGHYVFVSVPGFRNAGAGDCNDLTFSQCHAQISGAGSYEEASFIINFSLGPMRQFKANGTTIIPEESGTAETSVVLSATPQSIFPNQLRVQFELRPFGTPFTNQPTAVSAFVNPGQPVFVSMPNLAPGTYHWQANVIDAQNNSVPWQEFGQAGNIDFTVFGPPADFNYGLYYTLSSRNDVGTLLGITVQNGTTPFVGVGSFYIYTDDPNGLPVGSLFRTNMPSAFNQTLHQLFPAIGSLSVGRYIFVSVPAFRNAGAGDCNDLTFAQCHTKISGSGSYEEALFGVPSLNTLSLSGLQQFKADGTTPINEGGTTVESTVVYKAIITSSAGNQVRLDVQVAPFGTNFANGVISGSSGQFVPSGSNVTVTILSIPVGQYQARARVVDSQNNVSGWQEFGMPGNIDFIVEPIGQAASDLAKQVINGPYLGDGNTWGGKGWDWSLKKYVASSDILTGYTYWNNKLKVATSGPGVDCSGLVEWAFNRSFNPSKSLTQNVIRWESANGQYHNNSNSISKNNLNPGDLLFFGSTSTVGVTTATHVAMYVGTSTNTTFDMVEARSPQAGIVASVKSIREVDPAFLGDTGFRQVVISPSIAGSIQAGSPINLTVSDPGGFTISATTSIQTDEEFITEVPGELYYSQREAGLDGFPEDLVYWPTQKTGDYTVTVSPKAGVFANSTYSLTFQTDSTTVQLAQNVPISQIPNQGYGATVTTSTGGGAAISTFMPVAIDIKPGSYPNIINLGSNGVVPATIFGSATFDVHQINLASTTLANASIKLKGSGQPQATLSDVNGDGIIDLTVNFLTDALQLTSSSVKVTVDGFLQNGQEFKGSDSVMVVPQ